MQVTCALDPSALDPSLNLRRVIITDLENPQDIYCDASFALPITKEAASPPGSIGPPAFSPPAPPEAASRDALLTARAKFSDAARGSASFAAAAPVSGAPEPRATRIEARRRPATDDEIREQVKRPTGEVRTREEVKTALHALGCGARRARITPLLQEARGGPPRPTASDDVIREHLSTPTGTVRTREKVRTALHALGVRASAKRIDKQLQAVRGVVQRPSAPAAEIRAQLNHPDGTRRTQLEVLAALHTIGLGSTFRSIQLVERKELQQRAATGSQAGEE